MSGANLDDITRRAVRAAAGVAMFATAFGCGDAPTLTLGGSRAPSTGASDQQPGEQNAATVSHVVPVEMIEQAGLTASPIDAGVSNDAGSADAGTPETCSQDDGWEEYEACCQAVGWDPSRGCLAWGPPVPPSMAGSNEEVA